MSKPIDQELLPCPFCGGHKTEVCHADGLAWTRCKSCGATGPALSKYSGEEGEPCTDWNSRASAQPAGVAVPDAAGAMVKIGAALCTVALREIENATDSPRLSRCRLENALAACKDRLGGYAIDLRCAAAPHPVSGEQKAEPAAYLCNGGTKLMFAADRKEAIWNAGRPLYLHPPSAPAAQDVTGLVGALEYYARGDHFILADPDAWDTCSGEPQNWLHDDEGTASVEDGSVAKQALAAHRAQQGEQP